MLPITFTAVGLIALVGGGVLAAFSLRTESALTDPGLDRDDEDYLGRAGPAERVPGAEAETEKLPAHRPDLHPDPSGTDPPKPASGESPDAGPADPPDPGPASSGPPERT